MVVVQRVELAKGHWGLGFSIGGGVGSEYVEGDTGIYISKIISGGVAELDGRLEVGDKILSVGGESLTHYSQQQAVDLLRNTPEIVIITVLKQQAARELEHNHQKKLTASLNHLSITRQKTTSPPRSRRTGRGVFRTTTVVRNRSGSADPRPPYKPSAPTPLPITPQVYEPRTPVDTFQRSTPNQSFRQRNHHPTPATQYESNYHSSSHQHSNSLQYQTPNSQQRYFHQSQQPQPSHHSTPSHHTTPQPHQQSFHHTPQPPPQTPQQSYNTQTRDTSQRSQHSPANGVSHARQFHLEKGSSGLGFNIVGGEGGEGIYVSNITPGGVADLSGLIFRGDQLLEVNGVNLVGANHGFAVSALKSSGRVVALVCCYKPEEFNRFKARVEAGMEMNNNQAPQTKGDPYYQSNTGLRPDVNQDANGYFQPNGYNQNGPNHHGSTVVHFGQKEKKSTGCCPF